jgi:hypothetical protein
MIRYTNIRNTLFSAAKPSPANPQSTKFKKKVQEKKAKDDEITKYCQKE